MKQSEKLDLILKELYKHKYDGLLYPVSILLKDIGVATNQTEVRALTKELEKDGFIRVLYDRLECHAELKAAGVSYCEGDSYSIKGSSITTNNYHLTITNSPNSNIVSNSTSVSIVTNNYGDIKTKISELKESVANNVADANQKQELLDCVDELETVVDAGKIPKSSFHELIHMAGSMAEVGLIAIELGKLLHLIPQ